jgi:ATP-dependent DNA helicase RecQ
LLSPADILRKYWGYSAFRPLQEEVIENVLQGRDTLALMPTGAGKSLCYQVPALMKDGFCLVVSPLIALMQDQVKRLKELDIPAAFIHAGMYRSEVKQLLSSLHYGPHKLLYISPERLQTDLFREYLPEFNINLLAVDEAHCISQWGYDFRPDYLRIAELREEFPHLPMLALTASATPEVQKDITEKLSLRQASVLSQSYKRDNIYYEVKYSENKIADTQDAMGEEGSAIIYCRSRKQTELIASSLSKSGIDSAFYHAGMPKDKREAAQESWMTGAQKAIAATTAFGMGIDKADVRLVLHHDAPEHPEAYYQEAGRAGRDGKSSKALLLYNHSDIKRLRESTAIQYPTETYLRQVYQAVNEYLQIPIGNQPDAYFPFELEDFGKKFKLDSLPASYALRLLAQEGLWTISEAVFHPASLQFTADRHQLDNIVNTYPKPGVLITTLLRMYSTVFHYPAPISIIAVAQRLKMDKAEVEALLQQLQAMEVLEYNKPKDGPQLYFHHLRVDSRHLLLDMQRIHLLRQRHIARIEAIIAYMENTKVCREKMLLRYFGERGAADCGHCDICSAKDATAINNKSLELRLYELLQQKKTTSIRDIQKQYAGYDQQQLNSVIRNLVEEGKIRWHPDGSLSIYN